MCHENSAVEIIESISKKLNEVLERLNESASRIQALPNEEGRSEIRNIGRSIGTILQIQNEIYGVRPDLRPIEPEPTPDPELDEQQKLLVATLDAASLEKIDALLLSCATKNWRKVAMLVGMAMSDKSHIKGVPDIFYAQRVRKLVENGSLESQGNLQAMRFSEVRYAAQDT